MDFIENRTDEFLFMSIGQLARQLEVSEATISRFARHIGYHDFKELKRGVLNQKEGGGAARKLAGTLLKNQGFDMEKWIEQQKECLDETLRGFSMEEFERALDAVCAARRIFIHGKNASASAARLLHFRLRRLGLAAEVIPSGGSEVIEGIAHAGKGDLVILFCYSKISREARMILEYAADAGYGTLAFTGEHTSSAERHADISLYVFRGEKGEYHSMASAAAMVDALIVALSERMEMQSAESLIRIQKLKEAYHR